MNSPVAPPKPSRLSGVHIRPQVSRARWRLRHTLLALSFVLMVVLPVGGVGGYLHVVAADQYASNVGFSVRREEGGSAIESLTGIIQLSGSSSSDTDILYEYLQSQQLVAEVDAQLDLRRVWAAPEPGSVLGRDVFYGFDPAGTIEDLMAHWERKVQIYYDSGTGLIDLRVLSFDPEDSREIATFVYDLSVARINELSAVAREDAIRYAREELEQAEARLRDARLDLQQFRNRTQIIDPRLESQSQSGLVGALETQLAEAQIELAVLQETTRANDSRLLQAQLKIDVIRRQIADEKAKLGVAGGTGSVADLVGEYEVLSVDLEFAQEAYTAARAGFDIASNEARRQSRYLAAHVNPTLAERAEYPDRPLILALFALIAVMVWAITVLVAYALRDRR